MCMAKQLTYSPKISVEGKILTKKIFGADVKCIAHKPSGGLPSFNNLKAFAYVFLNVCFSDDHIMSIFLDELKQIQPIIVNS